MIRVLCLWLAERLEGNDRLQAPSKLSTELVGPRFFTDAKAADGRAWVGGFLEVVEGCDTKRVIAALELLATLIAVKLWVPVTPIMELTEELARKNSQLELSWLSRDHNQLADDLTNEKFDMFDSSFRIPLKGEELEWKVLDKLLRHSDSFYKEVKTRKAS
ncbi:unnamed protein product, partial [Symbiodinium pilosum]